MGRTAHKASTQRRDAETAVSGATRVLGVRVRDAAGSRGAEAARSGDAIRGGPSAVVPMTLSRSKDASRASASLARRLSRGALACRGAAPQLWHAMSLRRHGGTVVSVRRHTAPHIVRHPDEGRPGSRPRAAPRPTPRDPSLARKRVGACQEDILRPLDKIRRLCPAQLRPGSSDPCPRQRSPARYGPGIAPCPATARGGP